MELPSEARWAMREERGRGRLLVATEDIPAGQVVLAEAPVCWWVDAKHSDTCCARCVGPIGPILQTTAPRCASCGEVHWCSTGCKLADAISHATVCPLLATGCAHVKGSARAAFEALKLRAVEYAEAEVEALNLMRCVAHVSGLRQLDAKAFALFWGQHAQNVPLSPVEEAQCSLVIKALSESSAKLLWLDIEFIRGVCARDKANTHAIELSGPATLTGRSARAYGIYPYLSLTNHSCIPTLARFDTLEHDARGRARHALAPLEAAACVGSLRAALDQTSNAAELRQKLALPPLSLTMRLVSMRHVPALGELTLSYCQLDAPEPERKQVTPTSPPPLPLPVTPPSNPSCPPAPVLRPCYPPCYPPLTPL